MESRRLVLVLKWYPLGLTWTPAERLQDLLDMLAFEERAGNARLLESAKAEADLVDTSLPPMNFKLSVEERLRASVQGVPGFMRRRRRIEDLEAKLISKVMAAESPVEAASSAEVAADVALLNDLISRHNRYYPIEANLPVDVRTGQLLDRGVPWRPLPAVTSADLLALAAARR